MPNIATAPPQPTRTVSGLVAVDGRTFPLRAATIDARAEGGLAATTLIQEYANAYAEPLEVLYTMPLPADGAVVAYSFRLGERVVKGEIERREKARADYLRALTQGRTAGLLEQERADTFTQSLGNLPAGAAVTVEIQVLHPLAFLPAAGGAPPSWEWRFPTVTGVRYEGAEGRVPDAGKLDVPRADAHGTPVRVATKLTIDDGTMLTGSPRELDRDIVFTWAAASEAAEARLTEGPGLPGDDGRYAVITLTPPAVAAAKLARDLTVLIDASGSMGGAPLKQAKAVVRELLDSLTPGDRFQLLAFSTRVRDLTGGLTEAGPSALDAAREQLAELTASGGTEMAEAIDAALATLRGDAQRQVVLLTDGYIGFESEVAGRIRNGLPANSRVHVVGIGAAPNRTLTRSVARAGRGLELLIGPNDDPRTAAVRLARGTAAPVLTDVTVGGSGVRGFAPECPRDVFAGDPLVVTLELQHAGGTVEVSGMLAGSKEPWTRRLEVGPAPASYEGALPIGAFYGRERVEDLEAGSEITHDEIERVGLRHRIVTRFTSLVAISENVTVDPADPRRRERLAVELPYGVSAEGVGLARGFLGEAFKTTVGLMDESEYRITGRIESGRATAPRAFAKRATVWDRITGYLSKTGHDPVPLAVQGRLALLEGDKLIVELEIPGDIISMPLPGDELRIVFDDGAQVTGLCVRDGTTRADNLTSGLTVRVAIKLPTPPSAGARPRSVSWSAGDVTFTVEIE